MSANVALLLMWLLLAVYGVILAIDLGAGAFLAWAYVRRLPALERVVEAYATPVWEAVNGYLILLLLGMEAFFPRVINVYAAVLLIPLGITFALLSARYVGFAMRHIRVASLGRVGGLVAPLLLGVVGLLTPLPAMTFFTVLQGQGVRVVGGVVRYSLVGLVGRPLTLTFMLLALAAELHLGATVVEWFAALMREEGARRTARRAALGFGGAVAVVALLALAVYAGSVPGARVGIVAHAWLWALSLACLAASVALQAAGRAGALATALSAAMYLGGFIALGLSQVPWLVRGQVTTAAAFTTGAMARDIAWVYALGTLVVVVPSAALLTAYVVGAARRAGQQPAGTG